MIKLMQDYKQTIDFLYQKLPMFQRIGPLAFKKDLTNIIKLAKHLGNPQEKYKSLHIAGTNGKGSVSHILTSVFMENGYKTGLYTSPHLLDFRERIKIDGIPIGKEYVIDFVRDNRSFIEQLKPSFFEITVAMAFYFFAREEIDIAIVETGLGGRLDSTNIVKPELSIITNIALDHEYMLGNTIEEIAIEKAGIIKEGIPVLVGEKKNETSNVFTNFATQKGASIFFANESLTYKNNNLHPAVINLDIYEKDVLKYNNLRSDLNGNYQAKNIITALKAIEILKTRGFNLEYEHICSGISKTKKNTDLRGRWDILNKNPLIICDIAHNSNALESVISQLQYYDYNKLRIVFGLSKDKNLDTILSSMSEEAMYYFCRPDVPRGLEVKELLNLAKDHNLLGKSYHSVKDAIRSAREDSGKKDLILITGSAFVVAEALEIFN